MVATRYIDEGENSDSKNYRSISLLSVLRKVNTGVLVDRVHRVTEGLNREVSDQGGDDVEGENTNQEAKSATMFYGIVRKRCGMSPS